MKTPKEYKKALQRGHLSETLLSDVVYSLSKRAKNWQKTLKNVYRGRYSSHFDAAVQNCEKKISMYYGMKDVVLQECGIEPKAIHFVKRYTSPYLACRYECFEFEEYDCLDFDEKRYADHPCYQDCLRKEVKADLKRIDYFLYWEFGGHSFHRPISEEVADSNDLERIELDELIVAGSDVKDLLSVHFCKKVYEHFQDAV